MLTPAATPAPADKSKSPLYHFIDELPEKEIPTVRQLLELITNLSETDQKKVVEMLQTFSHTSADEDPDELTPEEIRESEEGLKEILRGEFYTLDELEKELADE